MSTERNRRTGIRPRSGRRGDPRAGPEGGGTGRRRPRPGAAREPPLQPGGLGRFRRPRQGARRPARGDGRPQPALRLGGGAPRAPSALGFPAPGDGRGAGGPDRPRRGGDPALSGGRRTARRPTRSASQSKTKPSTSSLRVLLAARSPAAVMGGEEVLVGQRLAVADALDHQQRRGRDPELAPDGEDGRGLQVDRDRIGRRQARRGGRRWRRSPAARSPRGPAGGRHRDRRCPPRSGRR